MNKITQLAHQCNRKSQSWPSAKHVWSAECQINSREFPRVELRRERTRAVLDIRRWRKQPDETAQSTKKDFAISVRHLSAIIDLLGAALAAATPITANNEQPQAATPTRSASGAAS